MKFKENYRVGGGEISKREVRDLVALEHGDFADLDGVSLSLSLEF